MDYEAGSARDVRRVLWRWGCIDRRISELMEQMKIAVDRANSLYELGGSRPMDGQPHGSTTSDPVFRAVERIQQMRELFAEEIETCEEQIRQAQDFKAAINEAIGQLSRIQQDVLRLRYIGGHDWTYIGFKLYTSESNARRYDYQACVKLGKLIDVTKVERF